jgi:hypothetical protein
MAKAKGSPKTGGRKKGTSNKFTKNVREAILAAFEEAGGVDYLRRVAKEDPKTFCTLLGKTMSTVVAGDEDKPQVLGVTIDRPPDEAREQWLAGGGDVLRGHFTVPATGASFGAGRLQTGHGALDQQPALELGDSAEHMQH